MEEEEQAWSRAELLQQLKRQEKRIKALETEQDRLKVRVKRLERRIERLPEETRQREDATREALKHLDDVEYLKQSRLAQIVAGPGGEPPDGQELRRALIRAIHSIEPGEGPPYQTPEERYHDVLRLAYLEKRKVTEVAESLDISERQCYRDLKEAVNRVAELVLELREE